MRESREMSSGLGRVCCHLVDAAVSERGGLFHQVRVDRGHGTGGAAPHRLSDPGGGIRGGRPVRPDRLFYIDHTVRYVVAYWLVILSYMA